MNTYPTNLNLNVLASLIGRKDIVDKYDFIGYVAQEWPKTTKPGCSKCKSSAVDNNMRMSLLNKVMNRLVTLDKATLDSFKLDLGTRELILRMGSATNRRIVRL